MTVRLAALRLPKCYGRGRSPDDEDTLIEDHGANVLDSEVLGARCQAARLQKVRWQ